jgi:hypothetical protein
MGYLTTITIYNDGCDQIKKYPEEFAEKVYLACLGHFTDSGQLIKGSFGLGYHANLVTVQKPRHADDHTIYVHRDNTVVEMNAWSKDCETLARTHPSFFDELLKQMENQVKELKKLKKRLDEKDSQHDK